MPVSAAHVPLDTAKAWAKRLARTSKTLTPQAAWPLARCQLAVAQMLGYEHWHALNQALALPVLGLPAPAAPSTPTKTRPLPSYGFPLKLAQALKDLTIRHTGAFLFTGMAGSGKSSLMASLVEHATVQRDPPEYRMPGVHAIPVIRPKNPTPNPYLQSGCAVAEIPAYLGQNKIRHARHIPAGPSDRPGGLTKMAPAVDVAIELEPSVLVIGEVRDRPSAEGMAKAIEAGITLFTTLHATQGAALDRLVDFDPTKNWKTMVRGWAHCCLLPVLCQQCARETVTVGNRRGPGCAACQYRGHIGRQMVVDLWEVKAGTPVKLFDMATQASDLIEAGRVDVGDIEDLMGLKWRDGKIMSAMR